MKLSWADGGAPQGCVSSALLIHRCLFQIHTQDKWWYCSTNSGNEYKENWSRTWCWCHDWFYFTVENPHWFHLQSLFYSLQVGFSVFCSIVQCGTAPWSTALRSSDCRVNPLLANKTSFRTPDVLSEYTLLPSGRWYSSVPHVNKARLNHSFVHHLPPFLSASIVRVCHSK